MLTLYSSVLLLLQQQRSGIYEMSTFTKTYNIQPNEKQIISLGKAFKTLAEYFLNEEKKDVEMVISEFQGSRISADLIVDGKIFESRIIGVNGGLTVV